MFSCSAINVKIVDFVQQTMRDTTTWLLSAWRSPIARHLSSTVKRGIFNGEIQNLGYYSLATHLRW